MLTKDQKQIACKVAERSNEIYSSDYWKIRNLRNAIKYALHFNELVETALEENKVYDEELAKERAEKLAYEAKKALEIAEYITTENHYNNMRLIGCQVSPLIITGTYKNNQQVSFLHSITLECINVETIYREYGHNSGAGDRFICRVISNPSKRYNGIHYKANELRGARFTFDAVSA